MARPMRVLLRWTVRPRWQQSSDEERKRNGEAQGRLTEKWKNDLGVKHITIFTSPSTIGGYNHFWLFELDDLNKIEEMLNDFGEALDDLIMTNWAWDLVRGNTDIDEWWAS